MSAFPAEFARIAFRAVLANPFWQEWSFFRLDCGNLPSAYIKNIKIGISRFSCQTKKILILASKSGFESCPLRFLTLSPKVQNDFFPRAFEAGEPWFFFRVDWRDAKGAQTGAISGPNVGEELIADHARGG